MGKVLKVVIISSSHVLSDSNSTFALQNHNKRSVYLLHLPKRGFYGPIFIDKSKLKSAEETYALPSVCVFDFYDYRDNLYIDCWLKTFSQRMEKSPLSSK